ncbi:uncharacterized protein LOC110923766 [Helianthus annuus]|uniref:uncharacterized protein LOC110923766 n=1 Tax=Helianthus annuus TaxID=4232 RepID=UPI000B8FA362|nr:uncharacterized protein LOC110923766 [Helianthus annuus]
MTESSRQQNVGLYYKSSVLSEKGVGSPKTAFIGEKMNESQTTSTSHQSGYHSSSKTNSEDTDEILCNIALKLKNSPAMSINAAKQQMSFLASVLESYEGLVAGKIGNSELTKEDYDQIDPEEMELIDIQEDRNDIVRKTAHGKASTAPRKFANVAEIKEEKEPAKNHEEKVENKEKTREEILSEKTHKERDVVYRRMDEMQEEYENAVSNKRWDKKRECYYNREGEPVAEEVETEAVEAEVVKVVEEQQIDEEEKKDVKSDAGNVGEEVSVEQKLNDAEIKQPEAAENTEVPITKVFLKKTECQPKEKRSSLAPEAADPCNG